MIDTLVGTDLTDVDEAFDAVGDLNERAEWHDLGDGAFDLRAYWKLLTTSDQGSVRVCLRRANASLSGFMPRITASTVSPA